VRKEKGECSQDGSDIKDESVWTFPKTIEMGKLCHSAHMAGSRGFNLVNQHGIQGSIIHSQTSTIIRLLASETRTVVSKRPALASRWTSISPHLT
jgi:hypothetical protein